MKKAIVIVFSAFLAGFFLLSLCLPDRFFSPMENRNLAQAPSFSLKSLASGAFAADFESYVTDQFPFRDGWMALKTGCERLMGKRESGGVYICGDTLIERMDEPDQERLDANLRAINEFAASLEIPVYVTILPTAQEIWRDRLPYGAPGCDEQAVIDDLAARCEAIYFDTLSVLRAHADEPIYYRTDHHWTSMGAYWGASALAGALGETLAPLDTWPAQTVSDSFTGTLFSKSGVRGLECDRIEIYVPDSGISVARYENGEQTPGLMYDMSRLEQKDQYSMFMGGNQPLAVVKSDAPGGQKLLLVRDSYADCEIPFLSTCFSEIHAVDLRYFKTGAAQYARENGISAVVISYSLRTFATDSNLYFLNAGAR